MSSLQGEESGLQARHRGLGDVLSAQHLRVARVRAVPNEARRSEVGMMAAAWTLHYPHDKCDGQEPERRSRWQDSQ
jgi:hypothetical protein